MTLLKLWDWVSNIDLPKHYSVNKTLVVNENLIWITPKTNHVGLGYYLVSLVMVDFFFFLGLENDGLRIEKHNYFA